MNIALVAHDGRKTELIEWVKEKENILKRHKLYATGTTGKLIIGQGFDNVTCLLSGPLGGDQQIGAMIAEGKIDMLIFFCDNLIVQGHQNDISALSRLASLYNIAFATNRTTADMLLSSPMMEDGAYNRVVPKCIESYKNRTL